MKDTFKILVPIGFSEQSLLALDQAIVFAEATGNAEITLLSVIEEAGFFKKMFKPVKDEDKLKKEVAKKLKEIIKDYGGKTKVPMDQMVAKGVVYEEIARVTELIEAQLVVMGTNGKPENLRKRFIGSNAYRTATLVKPPVVSVKGIQNPKKINTIIFPLVLDRRSKEKVGPAMHYARVFGAKIKIVSVRQDVEDAKILRAHLKQVERFINDHGVTATAELIDPTESKGVVRNLLHYAYKNDGDLVIITEDDRQRDITDFFLGSDVQAMLYHSEIPVMSITPSEVKWQALWDSF